MRRVELTGEREIDRFESVAARVRRVLWDAGEEHESGSDAGMTALVVEAEAISL